MKKLSVNDGNVLVLHTDPSTRPSNESLRRMVSDIGGTIGNKHNDLLVICIPKGWDIQSLDEEQMNEYGWYRKTK